MNGENESDEKKSTSNEDERKSHDKNILDKEIWTSNENERKSPNDEGMSTSIEDERKSSDVTIPTSREEELKSPIKSILGKNENIDGKTSKKPSYVNIIITVKIKSSKDDGPNISQEPGDQQLNQLPHSKPSTKKSRLQCTFCGKVMSSDYRLQCHLRKHTGATAGNCTYCGKNFSDIGSLKRHNKTCQREKSFPCHLCGKTFNSQKRLDIHTYSTDHSKKEDINQKISIKEEIKLEGFGNQSETDDEPMEKVRIENIKESLADYELVNHEKNDLGETVDHPLSLETLFKSELDHADFPINDTSLSDPSSKPELNSALNRIKKCEEQETIEGDKTVVCQLCGRTFHTKNIDRHVKACKLSGIKGKKKSRKTHCKVCGKNVHHLKTHARIHTGEKPFQCLECGERFSQNGLLTRHCSSVHTDIRRHKCSICEKSFRHKQNLTSHMRIHNEEKHPFQCDVCSKCLSSQIALDVHKKTHTASKEYLCTICGKTFKRTDCLSNHRATVHGVAKPYTCDRCGIGFLKVHFLTKHQRSCDSTVREIKRKQYKYTAKNHKCDMCTKAFKTRVNLEVHQRTHTGERPYSCGICGKTFTQETSYKYHAMSHTGEKPFQCDQCEKSFAHSILLKKHMRTHTGETPFKCEICNKEFNQPGNLARHKKIHDDKRPYECKTCGMTFKVLDILKQHERRHTGEKPFKCSLCEQAFSDSRPLKKHMLIHTEIKLEAKK